MPNDSAHPHALSIRLTCGDSREAACGAPRSGQRLGKSVSAPTLPGVRCLRLRRPMPAGFPPREARAEPLRARLDGQPPLDAALVLALPFRAGTPVPGAME
jgi:hypothetical protein